MSEVETPDPETIEKDELIQIKFKSNMAASMGAKQHLVKTKPNCFPLLFISFYLNIMV